MGVFQTPFWRPFDIILWWLTFLEGDVYEGNKVCRSEEPKPLRRATVAYGIMVVGLALEAVMMAMPPCFPS